ncbi:hypothetical protein NMS86_003612 [Vibrio cholerae]|uniref:hypothetical protein n=1 Tax=Vibrio cholerae TaxID=666 RepID=UPI001C9104BC|nr:hypothetical protein [Vibrio cholerae]EJL6861065.1 hypothetical protein [Vibrio cholerae]EKF9438081.1 hypothetical protein [Vibrio cholerae]MBY3693820.1 hypothetical protein [Vibrio cholerae]MCR9682809.1 hypothetical protein [Vibrio cholerae]MDA5319585.1 hypothetical protein [Vibrio cholerae]
MEQFLPFPVTNEMALVIGLFGPLVGKWLWGQFNGVVSKAKSLAIFRGLKTWKRERRYKHIHKLRRTRSIPALVHDQIAQANTYFLLFCMMVLFYMHLFIGSPIKNVFNINQWLRLILSFPVYFFEVKWLIASGRKKELLRVMRKKRV